jgi:LmbE family N-acetylglucosaminyl deacetylase
VRRALAVSLFLCIGAVGFARGQHLAPPGTGGVAALADLLEQLGANKRVLVIGAHPDDEDTQLLTYLSKGLGAQAAYLSLSRGEGGQNLIGPELGVELGVIRTEELLAARQLDGAHQFFTRAYDFGFSKNAAETFRFWSRDSLLSDVVAVIRRFRPQIIVSIFSGTPRDGHGQHQAAGLVAQQAFDLLKDSTWGPVKLYRSANFDTSGTSLRIAAGALDPIAGQSYYQIAMAGRSRHRSQDMGQLQRPGPSTIRLALAATKAGVSGGNDLFAGVDTTVRAGAFAALVDSARRQLNPWRPAAIVPVLARAVAALPADAAEQRRILERSLAEAAGVVLDAVADDDILVPGERVQVEGTVWNAGDATVQVDALDVVAPAGWTVQRLDLGGGAAAAGTLLSRRFAVAVSPSAERSQPYYLRRPLAGGLYDWTGVPDSVRGEPFEPPPLVLVAHLTIAGIPVTLRREVAFRIRDQAMGEIRRPLLVTNVFDVKVSPDLVVWPIDGGSVGQHRFTVAVTNRARGASTARVSVAVPRGWAPVPAETLLFAREDEMRMVSIAVTPPGNMPAGSYTVRVTAADPSGGRADGALVVIDYPHIRPRPVVHASTIEVRAARIALPSLTRVGYVRGASDRVPEALGAVGLPIELLSADSLARGDLSRFDAVVIGSRAYETDTALVANNSRILDYARAGGLVIVQYQQYPFIQGNFAPFPMTIARPHDRVTDETAAMTPLEPQSPVFRTPNAIGATDWEGWVQERGLYFAHDWDSTYVPLLESHDPGEAPLKGGLLVAPLGKGVYVYTGLSFFRQLPAGVPGAYRLFINLLGLGSRRAGT